ncbi:hypothetical protein [Pararhizobium sp. O133]|uniref:hypothetical protein n=1 Tax=Pararhizobium sp. O133 TaxID=3449278 RepID=UPI003F6835FA
MYQNANGIAYLPLFDGAEERICEMLKQIEQGQRVQMCAIGNFTEAQFVEINRLRHGIGLHPLENNEVLFVGRHIYSSRSRDGYLISDIVMQISSALSPDSIPIISPRMTCIQNPDARSDGYGNKVHDRAVFEMTARKPKAELFSVIPKGDDNKPIYAKSPPQG